MAIFENISGRSESLFVGVAHRVKSPKNQPQFSQTTMGQYWLGPLLGRPYHEPLLWFMIIIITRPEVYTYNQVQLVMGQPTVGYVCTMHT